jgi:membrane-bound lytic murein transglycosylase MltF
VRRRWIVVRIPVADWVADDSVSNEELLEMVREDTVGNFLDESAEVSIHEEGQP